MRTVLSLAVLTFFCAGMAQSLPAEQVPVRHQEGLVHGFLVLRTLAGEIIADGDLLQYA